MAAIPSSLADLTPPFQTPSFPHLEIRDYLRLVWIIGGYIFLRRYIELGFRKFFPPPEHESMSQSPQPLEQANGSPAVMMNANAEKAVAAHQARWNAVNVIRTMMTTSKSRDPKYGPEWEWGAASRRRQAAFIQAWEEEQARRAEEDDLEGIDPELLED